MDGISISLFYWAAKDAEASEYSVYMTGHQSRPHLCQILTNFHRYSQQENLQ